MIVVFFSSFQTCCERCIAIMPNVIKDTFLASAAVFHPSVMYICHFVGIFNFFPFFAVCVFLSWKPFHFFFNHRFLRFTNLFRQQIHILFFLFTTISVSIHGFSCYRRYEGNSNIIHSTVYTLYVIDKMYGTLNKNVKQIHIYTSLSFTQHLFKCVQALW